MRNNLIAEIVKKGYRADQTAKIIAAILKCSERTARNKINCVTDFTITEAMQINNVMFANKLDLEYLFIKSPNGKIA